MTEHYRHKQQGTLIIVVVGSVLVFIVGLAVYLFFILPESERFALIIQLGVAVVLIVVLVLFSSLSVVIEDERLIVFFGPGVIKKTLALQDIASCQVVKNPWYYGWGIRLTPHGWLFNVSGTNAVEVTMTNGDRYRIGTDVPEELETAINFSLKITPK